MHLKSRGILITKNAFSYIHSHTYRVSGSHKNSVEVIFPLIFFLSQNTSTKKTISRYENHELYFFQL